MNANARRGTLLQQLKQQAEAAPWLKWAGLGIAVLLALWVMQALADWRIAEQRAAAQAERNLQRILALNGQDVWLQREKDASLLREGMWAQLPEVATPGLAQAALQNWLREITTNMEVTTRINHSGPVEHLPGVFQVNASLSGAMPPGRALQLLRSIETAANLVTVETLRLSNESRPSLNLTLNAYYRVPQENAP